LLVEDDIKGAIALGDVIREESQEAVTTPKSMGIRCMMLAGVNQAPALDQADLSIGNIFKRI
jgi:cation transport ATPase